MARRDALREIAMLTFPEYKGGKISIDVADHVDRHVEDADTYYIDWLVDLAHIEEAGPNLGASDRYTLPISSGVPIRPGESAQITARAQTSEFRCARFVISNAGTPGGAADWIINDLKIGNRSQFSQSGDVPGAMFAANAIDGYMSFETARVAMDIAVIVTYVGPVESGAPFFGAMVGMGRAALPQYVRVQQPGTKISLGFACVSQRFNGEDTSITIFVPPIDQATIDVAIDATLTEGKPTQVVDTMIEHALDDRGGLVRDTYVALVVQRAGVLSAGEAQTVYA